MPARLIINADDFGLTPGINRAIAELHSAGALTSATLMANGPAFDDAISVVRAHPSLGVGCHIVLTDGVPLAPLEQIPGLLGPDGKTLRPTLADFIQALVLGKIKPAEIELEALFQIRKLQSAGIRITHLDTHKHTHIFPKVARQLIALAESNRIPAIRNPFEPAFAHALGHGSQFRRLAIALLRTFESKFRAKLRTNSYVKTTEGTLGISGTGDLTNTTLAEIMAALPDSGAYELCCHPGYNDANLDAVATRLRNHRDVERAALLDVIPKALSHRNPPHLINYGNLTQAE